MGKRYEKLFARYYDSFMENVEDRIGFRRRELISKLSGNILEVGSGTGVNFDYYNSDCKVIAIEPSSAMIEKAKFKKTNSNIEIYNYSIEDSELNTLTPEFGYDAIVCTLVLCTVPDIDNTLTIFKKILNENGKLIVLEHIHSKHPIKSKLQNLINPIWKRVGEGCNLNRNTDEILEKNGFYMIKESYFKHGLDFYEGVFELKN